MVIVDLIEWSSLIMECKSVNTIYWACAIGEQM